VRRSSFPSCSAFTLSLIAACAGPRASAVSPRTSSTHPPQATFAISHDNSVAERWPFGLNELTTKFIAEPAAPGERVASYWVVRSSRDAPPPTGAFVAEVLVRPEFPGASFEPRRGVDYELQLGVDRNGAETREVAPGRLEVRVPAAPNARQRGFIIRAQFPGDGEPHEPPKSLLIEVVRIVDEHGRELALGSPRSARWLIVEPERGAEPKRDAAPKR